MGRKLRTPKARKDLTTSELTQLVTGHDFFNDAFAGNLEAMREAFVQHRAEVIAEARLDVARPQAWAELVFDQGLDPGRAKAIRYGLKFGQPHDSPDTSPSVHQAQTACRR